MLSFYVAIVQPGDWRTPPAGHWQRGFGFLIAHPVAVYRVYGGRVDPADLSHCSFYFRWHANSDRGELFEVYLLDDDSVKMAASEIDWAPPE